MTQTGMQARSAAFHPYDVVRSLRAGSQRLPAHSQRAIASVLGIFSGVVILCVLLVAVDHGPAAVRAGMALGAGWVACLGLLWYAAVALCLRWRLTREDREGWLAALTLSGAVYVTVCSLRLVVGFGIGHRLTAFEDVGVVVAAVLLTISLFTLDGRRALPRIGPVRLGIALGLLGTILHLAAITVGDQRPDSLQASLDRVVVIAIAATGLLTLHHRRAISERLRRSLAAVWSLGMTACLLAPADPVRPSVWSGISLLAGLLGCAVLCRLAFDLLVRARAHAEAVEELATFAAEDATAGEQLHELRASFAGVASAIRLLAEHEADLDSKRRSEVTAMLAEEIDRLERLLSGHAAAPTPELELDRVLCAVVTARQLAGQRVEWRPSGCRVEASPDVVATAVNMLLVNASVHAPDSHVTVSAVPAGDAVRVRVTDDGPGVPESVRQRLFNRGVRDGRSPGQGIGLHFAGRLAAAQGGSLQLSDGRPGGTTFELTLPRTRERRTR